MHMQRREVLAVWILLSAPIVGFLVYLSTVVGLQFNHEQMPLLASMVASVVSLFFLSWMFLSHASRNWQSCARFMAIAFMFEGFVLVMTRNSGGVGSVAFGVGTLIAGLALFLGAKKH